MNRLDISSWSAFERTAFADALAAAFLFLMLAALWIVGAIA